MNDSKSVLGSVELERFYCILSARSNADVMPVDASLDQYVIIVIWCQTMSKANRDRYMFTVSQCQRMANIKPTQVGPRQCIS